MTSWQATSEDPPAGADGALRVVGLAAVCIGVAALAAATFVLSYQSIRAVALQAGIEPRYARGYPLLIDAMLVIVLAAVLALRGAGVPSRMLAWLTLLVVLCAAAGADTLHATGRKLPHNAAVVTAAVLPWALVFVAFVLLLAILRHARLRRHPRPALAQPTRTPPTDDGQARRQQRRAGPAPLPVRTPQSWNSVSIVPGFTSQLVTSAAAGAAAGAAIADVEPPVEGATPDDAELLLTDSVLEASAVELAEPVAQSAEPDAQPAEPDAQPAEPDAQPAEPLGQAPAADVSDETAVPDNDISPAEAGPEEPVPEVVVAELSDNAAPLTDEAAPQTDEAAPQTDEASPLTDEAAPLTDEPDPKTDGAPPAPAAEDHAPSDGERAQSAGDDEIPAFQRIRTSPTPPDD